MPFKRIFVPLDGSALAEEALSHAVALAQAVSASLFLLRVLDSEARGDQPADCIEWRLRKLEALRYLEDLAERRVPEGVTAEWFVTEGRAAEQIHEFITEHRIDLIVLSAWGSGGESEFPLGGTAQKIVAADGVSYLVVRQGQGLLDGAGAYRRILVPLDGSQRAEWAVEVVSGMIRNRDTEIVLLQIVESPAMPRRRPLNREEINLRDALIECNRKAAADYLDQVSSRLRTSHSVRSLLEVSAHVVKSIDEVAAREGADLIALMSQGASGANGWSHESICRPILMVARTPVLVLRESAKRAVFRPAEDAIDPVKRKIFSR